MESSRYDVVFRGRIREDLGLDQIRQNLSIVLKNDTVKVERLLAKKPVIIKKAADSKTALSLMEIFKNAGLECEMVPAGEHATGATGSSASVGVGPSDADVRRTITCPNCGLDQRSSMECVRCGIIFSKYVGHSTDNAGIAGAPPGDPRVTIQPDEGGEGNRVWLLLSLLIVVLIGAGIFWSSADLRYPPGVLVPSEPSQAIIEQPTPWKKGDKVFIPMAVFSLRARVLSAERYRFDAGADICPIDLVLGWGPMSDQGILDKVVISQNYRRFVIAPLSPGPPLPIHTLMQHCANMHMIPSSDDIEDRLTSLRVGEVIDLQGYLVGIQQNGQWTWVSSLTRNDVGDGSCEVIWVRSLEVATPVVPSEKISAWTTTRLLS